MLHAEDDGSIDMCWPVLRCDSTPADAWAAGEAPRGRFDYQPRPGPYGLVTASPILSSKRNAPSKGLLAG